jgi:hypothetical protein
MVRKEHHHFALSPSVSFPPMLPLLVYVMSSHAYDMYRSLRILIIDEVDLFDHSSYLKYF